MTDIFNDRFNVYLKDLSLVQAISRSAKSGNTDELFTALTAAELHQLFEFEAPPASDNEAQEALRKVNSSLSQKALKNRFAATADTVSTAIKDLEKAGLDCGLEATWQAYFTARQSAVEAKIPEFVAALRRRQASVGLINDSALRAAMDRNGLSMDDLPAVAQQLESAGVRILKSLPQSLIAAIDNSGATNIVSLVHPSGREKANNLRFSLRRGKSLSIFDLSDEMVREAGAHYDKFGSKHAAAKKACNQLASYLTSANISAADAAGAYVLAKADAQTASGVFPGEVVDYLTKLGVMDEDARLLMFGETAVGNSRANEGGAAGSNQQQTAKQPSDQQQPRQQRQAHRRSNNPKPQERQKQPNRQQQGPQSAGEFWSVLGELMARRQIFTANNFYERFVDNFNLAGRNEQVDQLEYELINANRKREQAVMEMDRAFNLRDFAQVLVLYDAFREFCVDDPQADAVVAKARKAISSGTAQSQRSMQELLLPERKFPIGKLVLTCVAIVAIYIVSVILGSLLSGETGLNHMLSGFSLYVSAWIQVIIVMHFLVPTKETLESSRVLGGLMKSKHAGTFLIFAKIVAVLFLLESSLRLLGIPFVVMTLISNGSEVVGIILASLLALGASGIAVYGYLRSLISLRSTILWNRMINKLGEVFTTGENFGVFRTQSSAKSVGSGVFEANAHFVFPQDEERGVRLKKKGLFNPSKGTWVLMDDNNAIDTMLSAREVNIAHKAAKREVPGVLI